MRRWVAHEETVPISVLGPLATGHDETVRFTVALKRKLTTELLNLLSRDPYQASVDASQ